MPPSEGNENNPRGENGVPPDDVEVPDGVDCSFYEQRFQGLLEECGSLNAALASKRAKKIQLEFMIARLENVIREKEYEIRVRTSSDNPNHVPPAPEAAVNQEQPPATSTNDEMAQSEHSQVEVSYTTVKQEVQLKELGTPTDHVQDLLRLFDFSSISITNNRLNEQGIEIVNDLGQLLKQETINALRLSTSETEARQPIQPGSVMREEAELNDCHIRVRPLASLLENANDNLSNISELCSNFDQNVDRSSSSSEALDLSLPHSSSEGPDHLVPEAVGPNVANNDIAGQADQETPRNFISKRRRRRIKYQSEGVAGIDDDKSYKKSADTDEWIEAPEAITQEVSSSPLLAPVPVPPISVPVPLMMPLTPASLEPDHAVNSQEAEGENPEIPMEDDAPGAPPEPKTRKKTKGGKKKKTLRKRKSQKTKRTTPRPPAAVDLSSNVLSGGRNYTEGSNQKRSRQSRKNRDEFPNCDKVHGEVQVQVRERSRRQAAIKGAENIKKMFSPPVRKCDRSRVKEKKTVPSATPATFPSDCIMDAQSRHETEATMEPTNHNLETMT